MFRPKLLQPTVVLDESPSDTEPGLACLPLEARISKLRCPFLTGAGRFWLAGNCAHVCLGSMEGAKAMIERPAWLLAEVHARCTVSRLGSFDAAGASRARGLSRSSRGRLFHM